MKDELLNFSILEGHLGKTSQGRVTKLSYSIFYAHLHIMVFHFFTIFEIKNAQGAIGWGFGEKSRGQNFFGL